MKHYFSATKLLILSIIATNVSANSINLCVKNLDFEEHTVEATNSSMFSTIKIYPQNMACNMSPDINNRTEFNVEVDGIPSVMRAIASSSGMAGNVYDLEVDKKGMIVGRNDSYLNDNPPEDGFIWGDVSSYSSTADTNTFYIGPNYHIIPTFFLPSGITSLTNIQLKDIKTGTHKLTTEKSNPVFNSERFSDFTYSWKVDSKGKIDEPNVKLKLQDNSCNTYTTTATGDTKFKTCVLSTESESTWEIRTGFDKENVNTDVNISSTAAMQLNTKITANNVTYDLSNTKSIDLPFASTYHSINYSFVLAYATKTSDTVNINLLVKPEGYCTTHNNGSLKTCMRQIAGKWQIKTTDIVTANTMTAAKSTTAKSKTKYKGLAGILPWSK